MSNLDGLSPNTRNRLAAAERLLAQYPDTVVHGVPKDGDYDHRCAMMGLLYATVCTRRAPAEAADWLSTVRPPGTSHNRWVLDESQPPEVCEKFPATHTHVTVEC